MSLLAVVAGLVVLGLTTPFWWPAAAERSPRLLAGCAALAAVVLAAVVLSVLVASPVPGGFGVHGVVLGAVAVAGGGPPIAALLELMRDPDEHPEAVLRGGAWIGVLERASVFLSIATGLPEAVAVVVAVKGLGRYPELSSAQGRGAAERFIAGTLASLLWAGACGVLAVRL